MVVQFTDTHVSAPGRLHFGSDSARYLADAIVAANALVPRPQCAIVTGDLADFGTSVEYAVFREVMQSLEMPYFVVPGNHDDRDVMRAVLPARAYANVRDARARFVVDDLPLRVVALDTKRGRFPGGELTRGDLSWLARTLDEAPNRPTIVAVHHPPFASGLPYLDLFGFRGARKLRTLLATRPSVGRVIAGHVHHVVQTRWENALLTTAPSTVPQRLPLLFAKGKIAGRLAVRAGFATHGYDSARGSFETAFFERDDLGTYRRTIS